MTDEPTAGDSVRQAAQRLILAVLASPTLELVLVAGVVNVIAHMFWGAIGHDTFFIPVIIGVAAYDALVAIYMVKTMWRRILE